MDIFGIASGVANAGLSLLQNKKNREFQKEQSDIAWQRQQDMFNLQNEYNSPKAQVQRLIDAGLNPNLAYGNAQFGGLASAPSVPQGDSTPLPAPQFDYTAHLQSRLLQSQIKQMDKQNELTSAEVWRIFNITPFESKKIEADADRVRQMIQSDEYQTSVNQLKNDVLNGKSVGIYDDDINTDGLKSLIVENHFRQLLASNSDYKKACQLFQTEIGIRNAELNKLHLENKDLEQFVKVCARIYNADASQAEYLGSIAELNKDLYGRLGASNEVMKLVFSFLQLMISSSKSLKR